MKTARRILIALGTLVIGYAALGALFDPDVKLIGMLIFLVAVLVTHDGILLPLYIGIGAIVGRVVPAAARTPVRVGLILSLAVTLVALPTVLGFGHSADNPSILPLHYGRGLLETLGLIWAAIGATAATRARHHRPRRPGSPLAAPRRRC
jgi:hypothetical protein